MNYVTIFWATATEWLPRQFLTDNYIVLWAEENKKTG